MSFRLVTDGTCDLSPAVALERDIPVIPFKVSVGNEDFRPYNGDPGLKNTFSIGEFYARMRAQENTHTSQINPEDYIRYFTPMLEAGEDVLYLAFSSGLSGSCQNAMLAARELEEKYPGRRLEVVDTLCASLGEGLLVWLVDDQRKSGASLDQARDYALALRKRIVHAFTVDDLNFLRRGGRLSGAAAVLGTMLSIKPILDVNAEGKLAVFDKVQGRKRALKALVDRMEACTRKPDAYPVFITYADCREDALLLAAMVRERFHVEIAHMNDMGPIIGGHAGPGTLALVFVSDEEKK